MIRVSKIDRHNMLIRYMNKHNMNIITRDEAMKLWSLAKGTTRNLLNSFDDFENIKVNVYKYKFEEEKLGEPTKKMFIKQHIQKEKEYIKQQIGDISGK